MRESGRGCRLWKSLGIDSPPPSHTYVEAQRSTKWGWKNTRGKEKGEHPKDLVLSMVGKKKVLNQM